jgi:hypothetical protein
MRVVYAHTKKGLPNRGGFRFLDASNNPGLGTKETLEMGLFENK